jgi:hypothetical protein
MRRNLMHILVLMEELAETSPHKVQRSTSSGPGIAISTVAQTVPMRTVSEIFQ